MATDSEIEYLIGVHGKVPAGIRPTDEHPAEKTDDQPDDDGEVQSAAPVPAS
jgi:hypothetical protein